MALYLVQHGRSLPEDVDPRRGLSPEGRVEVEAMAARAAAAGIRVARIEHSGKWRAQQTAELLGAALGPAEGIHERAGLAPKDDVEVVAAKLRAADGRMLVGHLPFMERLTGWLVAGDAGCRVLAFQNAGIVALDQAPDTGAWFIRWTLLPRVD